MLIKTIAMYMMMFIWLFGYLVNRLFDDMPAPTFVGGYLIFLSFRYRLLSVEKSHFSFQISDLLSRSLRAWDVALLRFRFFQTLGATYLHCQFSIFNSDVLTKHLYALSTIHSNARPCVSTCYCHKSSTIPFQKVRLFLYKFRLCFQWLRLSNVYKIYHLLHQLSMYRGLM